MEINGLIEKLSLQVTSFQESFELLSNSQTLRGMAEEFDKILRGNFFTTDINIFHKTDRNSNWDPLYRKSPDKELALDDSAENSPLNISAMNNSKELVIVSHLFDGSIVGINLGGRLDGSPYNDFDKISLQVFVQLFDNAYQTFKSRKKEKDLIFSLNHRLLQLNRLIDTGIEVGKFSMRDSMLSLALQRAVALTNASMGCVSVLKEDEEIEKITFPPEIELDEIESENILTDTFADSGREYKFVLIDKETRSGITSFDETDSLLFGAITKQVQAAIENERHHTEALETEAIKRELAVAGDIQKKILPERLPEIDGYDIAGINIPSKEVSGDYYNVFTMDDGRFGLVVADVTGKGVPASLLVSTLDAALQSYLDFKIPLPEMAVKINSIIYKASTADKFITFFISVLDPATGELDIINAGHNPSLLLKIDGTLQKIEAGGVAFGMFDMGLPFEGTKMQMNKGERLLLFSDGIPEAMDEDEEEYSDERLDNFFQNTKPNTAQEFITKIVDDVRAHTKDTPQSDDITAIYLIRKE